MTKEFNVPKGNAGGMAHNLRSSQPVESELSSLALDALVNPEANRPATVPIHQLCQSGVGLVNAILGSHYLCLKLVGADIQMASHKSMLVVHGWIG